MELWEQVSRQRVQYIIDSYELDGEDGEDFNDYLEELLIAYAPPQIELAIVETIVASWLKLPSTKGIEFMEQAHERLKAWESNFQITITPSQFRQITGLDPTPVFGQYRNNFCLS
ncbi:hypothetical protein Syn7502_00046 [Synechococcus sp. PCC 7502]|uniref:hypothetical protein n=1 Tax=Synechococcus sp. PCC 7502 TaxID=1173263 RepID=UPI00029FF349|nr:hypothetical protein [Synechococcus sp. PCC 7502]AFY72221.1 hypothetical protein Syn7502_00046 [Synechococcus sp. PCC 7502]